MEINMLLSILILPWLIVWNPISIFYPLFAYLLVEIIMVFTPVISLIDELLKKIILNDQ
jgi:hypothetical protein